MKDYKVAEFDVDDDVASGLGINYHPGYSTPFTRNRAPGAFSNDTVVVKINSEATDATNDGVTGKVLGSLPVPPQLERLAHGSAHFYFVEWDDDPGRAVGLLGYKLKEVQQ